MIWIYLLFLKFLLKILKKNNEWKSSNYTHSLTIYCTIYFMAINGEFPLSWYLLTHLKENNKKFNWFIFFPLKIRGNTIFKIYIFTLFEITIHLKIFELSRPYKVWKKRPYKIWKKRTYTYSNKEYASIYFNVTNGESSISWYLWRNLKEDSKFTLFCIYGRMNENRIFS